MEIHCICNENTQYLCKYTSMLFILIFPLQTISNLLAPFKQIEHFHANQIHFPRQAFYMSFLLVLSFPLSQVQTEVHTANAISHKYDKHATQFELSTLIDWPFAYWKWWTNTKHYGSSTTKNSQTLPFAIPFECKTIHLFSMTK